MTALDLDAAEIAAELRAMPPPPRRGDWCQTFTGVAFWPLDPRPEDVRVEDIAHALSMQCRFAGHCREFYSVAEHSVRVSWACDFKDALWGLLHDASEAYVVDVPRPLKPYLANYADIETSVQVAVCRRFGISITQPPSVKRADVVLLATEARDLMSTPPIPWGGLLYPPLVAVISPWSPAYAEMMFLTQFAALTKGTP